jgi:hypothetical protein
MTCQTQQLPSMALLVRDWFEYMTGDSPERQSQIRRMGHAKTIETAPTLSARFAAIRAYWNEAEPTILRSPINRHAIPAYDDIDWARAMTPIEFALWCDIRSHGVILYPQYPVGRFFVDFGHPAVKVAVECDGARYHRDQARETMRDGAIRAAGWTIYHLSGASCLEPAFLDPVDWYDEHDREVRLVRPVGFVLRKLNDLGICAAPWTLRCTSDDSDDNDEASSTMPYLTVD